MKTQIITYLNRRKVRSLFKRAVKGYQSSVWLVGMYNHMILTRKELSTPEKMEIYERIKESEADTDLFIDKIALYVAWMGIHDKPNVHAKAKEIQFNLINEHYS